jgi:hypothetical protein
METLITERLILREWKETDSKNYYNTPVRKDNVHIIYKRCRQIVI